jgi:phage gp36-like protein
MFVMYLNDKEMKDIMNTYRITIRTYFGKLEVDDVKAEDEETAFQQALKEACYEIDNYGKLDEVYEYPKDNLLDLEAE